jgi:hypothetical protein
VDFGNSNRKPSLYLPIYMNSGRAYEIPTVADKVKKEGSG